MGFEGEGTVKRPGFEAQLHAANELVRHSVWAQLTSQWHKPNHGMPKRPDPALAPLLQLKARGAVAALGLFNHILGFIDCTAQPAAFASLGRPVDTAEQEAIGVRTATREIADGAPPLRTEIGVRTNDE